MERRMNQALTEESKSMDTIDHYYVRGPLPFRVAAAAWCDAAAWAGAFLPEELKKMLEALSCDDDPSTSDLEEMLAEATRRARWLPCGKAHFVSPRGAEIVDDALVWDTSVRTALRRAPGCGWEIVIEGEHPERVAAAESELSRWALVVYAYPERDEGHREERSWRRDPADLPDHAEIRCRAVEVGQGSTG